MTWTLREIANPFPRWDSPDPIEPGDCWRLPIDRDVKNAYGVGEIHTYAEAWGMFLSPEFKASGRDYVIFLRLPDGTDWCIDHASSDSIERGQPQGWTVSGELPAITVNPSINVVGRYHGWVQNGVLTDDLDGRTFAPGDGVTPRYGAAGRNPYQQ